MFEMLVFSRNFYQKPFTVMHTILGKKLIWLDSPEFSLQLDSYSWPVLTKWLSSLDRGMVKKQQKTGNLFCEFAAK